MDGTVVFKNDLAEIDCSNASEGYIFARYLGENQQVKLLIQIENGKKYYYDLKNDGTPEVFPLSVGDGLYEISVFENIDANQYSLALSETLEVKLNNPYLPFLYPNQYVRFDKDTEAVKKAEELARPADEDLDVVSNVYNYVIGNVVYDMEEAETVESGYLPDVDEILETGKGICLDYSALMCAMLRSQQIPARMEIGYAGTAYHAWISVYIEGIGWVNGMIEFDGKEWSLMDPTFAASNGDDFLKDFIGDGDNYTLKFIY
ncbi:MAG: transglutaminase domain-containing protein [Lachnospiraceae bacterium]|nr:transglutaminase domain-containing protein [Lachnospiraceae bacterium]